LGEIFTVKDILIVEDQTSDRERLSKLFNDAGYTVESCEGVVQAEKALEGSNFRLAVLDIGLGDKSGSHLFYNIKRIGKVPYVIIFTGNPSVHLKQRLIGEGASDYIVKGSPQAQGDKFLARVKEIIGSAAPQSTSGIALEDFLTRYIDSSSRKLFLNMDSSIPKCSKCGGGSYVVSFTGIPQIPPDITGKVKCVACGTEMDPEVV